MAVAGIGAVQIATCERAIGAANGTPIDRVSIETSIPKTTLRVWERRYAFPKPARDKNGDRVYSEHDIDKLKALKRLVDNGFRPSAIANKTLIELHALYRDSIERTGACLPLDQLQPLLDLVRDDDVGALRRALQARLQDGLERFVLETAAPLSATVGVQWALGALESFQERLVTELLLNLLGGVLDVDSGSHESPAVALATLEDDQSKLGLRMTQALLSAHRAQCNYVGTQVPVGTLIDVSIAQEIDVVPISISPGFSMSAAGGAIAALDAALPFSAEVWISGTIARDLTRMPERVRLLPSLPDIRPTRQSWRAAHPLRMSQRGYH